MYDLPNCEEKGHVLNKVEVWTEDNRHWYSVIQCSRCGSKARENSLFLDYQLNIEKRYYVKEDGQWQRTNYEDLVFEFENQS